MHTSELQEGSHTSDARIAEVADGEGRVVVTKDRDFRDGHLLSGSPHRLGHRDASTTLRIYRDAMPLTDSAAAATLDGLFR